MEKWLIAMETSHSEQEEFNALVEREVTLLKITAIIAKQIVLTANEYGTEADLVYKSVGSWLNEISSAGIEIKAVKD